jgi:hypothetical protein
MGLGMKCGVNERVCAYVYAHVRVAQIGYVQWLTDGVGEPGHTHHLRDRFPGLRLRLDASHVTPRPRERGYAPTCPWDALHGPSVCARSQMEKTLLQERPGSKHSKQHCEALVALEL